MKIAIGSDHAGYSLKTRIIELLKKEVELVKDYGPSTEESVDYADYAHPLAEAVESKVYDFGILICGSGNGINMTANKHQGIRSALCWQEDIAVLARQHNNANILVLPARFITENIALSIVKLFITTEFEGGRHEKRVNKIPC